MDNAKIETLGLFPLSLVILPHEQTRLHIFEARYKQLINDCFANNKDFGIPAMIDGKPMPFGTRVKLVDIERFYPDGKMDIRIEGVSVFKLKSIDNNIQNKMYAGGEIETLPLNDKFQKRQDLMELFYEFCLRNGSPELTDKINTELSIYEIAKQLVLTNEEKYQLMETTNTLAQQKMLTNHLKLVLALYRQEDDLNNRFFLN